MEPTLITRADGLWVIAKPAGFVTHPTCPDDLDVLSWCVENLDASPSLAPIHRLDKGTSGVLLLSPDDAVRAQTATWFQDGSVKKRYLALVYGVPNKKGVIRRALKDARRKRALAAVTRYKRLDVFGSCSLVTIRPETGRKHQIRRHMQSIGHAVAGDSRYPNRKRIKIPDYPNRMWLHCDRLELPDGRAFEAPLPTELIDHLTLLRERAANKDEL